MDRREALKKLGSFAAGAAALGCSGESGGAAAGGAEAATTGAASTTASAGEGAAMASGAISPVGVQLYTVRSEMANGVEATLERVAEIGYREVEFAGYYDHSPAEIRAMLERTGLTSPASHVPPNFDEDAWAQTLEDTAEAGHDYAVVAFIPNGMRESLDDWRRTADIMNRAGEQARAMGLQYAYHNHDFEFAEMDGQVAFDVFCQAADPELVQIELDIFWITHAGHDPLAFLQRWPDRVPCVHVKDRTPDGEMVDVGEGVIDWAEIFGSPAASGIRHHFVEHDRPDGPFHSIQASYDYLSSLQL